MSTKTEPIVEPAAATLPDFPVTYHEALAEYLSHPGEATLHQAYELGRAAMNAGLGIVDIIRLHHQALLEDAAKGRLAGQIQALESFLLEALSPFEAAYRGFRDARQRLQQINHVLAERNEELLDSNANLEEEIKVRQKAEGALRESKDHYFRLFQQAHAMEQDLRELSAKIFSAQEDERKRISRELHDEVGQALTAVNVAIVMLKKQARSDPVLAKRVTEAEQIIEQMMETVHRFARDLRPAILDHLGLLSALRSHVSVFAQRTGIKTELVAHPDLALVDGARAEAMFRVAQEALNNVFRHARATAVEIRFSVTEDSLCMDVTDNGCAFSVAEKLGEKPNGRLGLLGMQERMRHVNGMFAIESEPGKGTHVRARLPLHGRARQASALEDTDPLFTMPATTAPAPATYENNIRAAC
jgi:signal transduction histidine kinase